MSPIDLTPIFELPVEQRQEIVERINESIAREVESIGLSEEQKQELDRRLVAYRANPDDVIPWEDIERDALARRRMS